MSTKFLKNLVEITKGFPIEVCKWNNKKDQFDILNHEEFFKIVENTYSVKEKTFLRHLYYYNFEKINIYNGGGDEKTYGTFSIRNPHFKREKIDLLLIKRVVSHNKQEQGHEKYNNLKKEVAYLNDMVNSLEYKHEILDEKFKRLKNYVENI